jgi:hypothetical protein
MSGDDLTISILREIRDEIRTTRTDLGARIDATNQRLETGLGALDQRLGETNLRLDEVNGRLEVVETTLKDFAGQHLLLTRYVRNSVDRHDDAIDDLRDRVEKLETQPKPAP